MCFACPKVFFSPSSQISERKSMEVWVPFKEILRVFLHLTLSNCSSSSVKWKYNNKIIWTHFAKKVELSFNFPFADIKGVLHYDWFA